jgi:hypothetical protein
MADDFDPNIFSSGESAVRFAQQVRSNHRRRTERTSAQRQQDVEMAMERIADAMVPIRTLIGRYPHRRRVTPALEEKMEAVHDLSGRLQAERRKLWKMQHPPKTPYKRVIHRVKTLDDLQVSEDIE